MATYTVTTGNDVTQYTVSTGARGPMGPFGTLTSYVDQVETLPDYPATFPADHAPVTVSGNGISLSGQQVSLSIGTGETQVAAGNHTHAQLHDAVTVSGNGLSLSGQQISLSIGTGSTQVAAGDHTHAQLHDRQHSVTSTSDHTFPGGTTTFLRADGTFATPPETTVDNAAVNAALLEDPVASRSALGIGSVFYATDYGVTADGTTDDTEALQAAIDAAHASALVTGNPASVIMPAGRIMVSRSTLPNTYSHPQWKFCIRMYSNVRLSGAGMSATTIKVKTGTVGDTAGIDSISEFRSNATVSGGTTVTVSSTEGLHVGMQANGTLVSTWARIASIVNDTTLTLDASITNGTADIEFGPVSVEMCDFTVDVDAWNRFGTSMVGEGECINVKGGTHIRFHRVRVLNAEQDGFDMDGGNYFLFDSCVAEDCWGSGLHMVANGVGYVLVNGCRFSRNGFGRRASNEGGIGGTGGVHANGSGIDTMGQFINITGCTFKDNAVEAHNLAGTQIFTGCSFDHVPNDSRYPSMNSLPAVIAGWTALSPVGNGEMTFIGCEIAANPTTNNTIEVLNSWPRITLAGCKASGKIVVTSGKDMILRNCLLDALGGAYNAVYVVSSTGRVILQDSLIRNYLRGVRVDSASGGIIQNCTFEGSSGSFDVHFTGSGTSSGWSIIGNRLTSSSTTAISVGANNNGHTISDNFSSTTSGASFIIGNNASTQNNYIARNSIFNLTVGGGSSTGNIFENNLINGTISHPSATNFASNTWLRNTGPGCAGIFYGTATLASGTATVNTAAANSARKWNLTRQAPNASTAIGSPSIGAVTAQTSFVINALKADATVETGDASSVYWQIVE